MKGRRTDQIPDVLNHHDGVQRRGELFQPACEHVSVQVAAASGVDLNHLATSRAEAQSITPGSVSSRATHMRRAIPAIRLADSRLS